MNALVKQVTRLSLAQQTRLLTPNAASACRALAAPLAIGSGLHTTSALSGNWNKHKTGPQKWLENNKVVHAPQQPDEEPRKAYVCHMRSNIKYSPDKMWYIACLVRGMSVDEAVKQLSFVLKKGATHIREVILEAQEMAVKQHNVEFKSNLWISESNVGKGRVFRGMRRHARGRMGMVEYKHCHYFVRLEEGEPPKHFYLPEPQTPKDQFEKWMQQMRSRKVINSL